jgi:hypothetical protein
VSVGTLRLRGSSGPPERRASRQGLGPGGHAASVAGSVRGERRRWIGLEGKGSSHTPFRWGSAGGIDSAAEGAAGKPTIPIGTWPPPVGPRTHPTGHRFQGQGAPHPLRVAISMRLRDLMVPEWRIPGPRKAHEQTLPWSASARTGFQFEALEAYRWGIGPAGKPLPPNRVPSFIEAGACQHSPVTPGRVLSVDAACLRQRTGRIGGTRTY